MFEKQYRVGGKARYFSLAEAKAAAQSIFVVTGNVVAVEEVHDHPGVNCDCPEHRAARGGMSWESWMSS